jgi:hypothetical protein
MGFSRPREFKIGAWLIQKWMNREYSHVYISWIDDQGRDIIFQAAHGCVHTLLRSNFVTENIIVKEKVIETSEENYQKARDFLYFYLGEVYSTRELALIVVYDVLTRVGIPVTIEDSKGFICSELGSRFLNYVYGYKIPKKSFLMRPDDVEKMLENS